MRVDSEDEAVVDEGVGNRESLATTHGTSEEEVAPPDGKGSDSSFTAPVVYLEPPIVEATPKVRSLVDGIPGCSSQRRLGQEFRVNRIDPFIERTQQRQRFLLTLREAVIQKTAGLAVRLDGVDVDPVLERNRGPPVFGQQNLVELVADAPGAPKVAKNSQVNS